jgi:hypothetical protein
MKLRNGLYGLNVLAAAGLMVWVASCAEPSDEGAPGFGDSGTQAPNNPITTPPGTGGTGGTASGTGNTGGLPPATDAGSVGNPPTPTQDAGTTPVTPGDAGTQPPSGDSKLWCDARAVLQTRCQTCHGTVPAGAPMSLVTHADTQKASALDATKTMVQMIKARIHDAARPMPPVAQGKLTTQELAALDAWLNGGTPNGTCATPDVPTKPPADEFKWPAECEETYKIQAHQNGKPYPVPANYEGNVQISIPVPWAGKGTGGVHALAIRPLTNNQKVVHHWILYAGTMQFVTSWSPGKEAETFPSDVGVYMPTSGNFRLNMHYYNKGNSKAEVDDSGAEICITRKLKPKTATTNMFGPSLLNIGPGRTMAESTCTQGGTQSVTLITSSPHMHQTGVGAKFEIIRKNGTVEMLDDSAFNWEDQSIKPIMAVVNPGDKIKTTCIYNNTTGRTIRFGESTEDEMCFNFSRYIPMGALNCSAF